METCPHISAWRRAVCGDLTGVFDFTAPVNGLPALPGTATVIGQETCAPLPNPKPTTNALPAQESGTRPARALPYQPNGYLDHLEFGADGKILAWITMVNEGPQAKNSAHFSIHPNAFRSRTPWQYTVKPYNAATGVNGTATDFFNIGAGFGDGKYDLILAGANRFLRRFIGDATKAGKNAQVSSYYKAAPNTGKLAIWFRMKNTSSAAVTFTIKSNHYRTDGPWTYQVPAGGTVDDYFNAVANSGGWYDFTVTVNTDATWSQRYTGHLETGPPSVTG